MKFTDRLKKRIFDDDIRLILHPYGIEGVNVNGKDKHGYTAIMYAAHLNHKDTVEKLISMGADVNATSLIGNSVLKFANGGSGGSGNTEIVKILKAAGAKE